MDFKAYLRIMVEREGSDLYFSAGAPVSAKINGSLTPIDEHVLSREDVKAVAWSVMDDEQIAAACLLARDAGADYVKTSTGFGTGGATLGDVRLMKDEVVDAMEIKASGGIRDYETAMKYLEAGVTRIGTSSGEAILRGEKKSNL